MKKTLLALLTSMALTTPAMAEDVKIGVLLGFTGPIESLTPDMAFAAELAIKEVNRSKIFLKGSPVSSIRADSTCVDAAGATASANRLITADGVKAIMGADCSGVTIATLQNVALANGIVMISPSATSPALTDIPDNNLFFRTSPSDARQGSVLAKIMRGRGLSSVAMTYTNNDYGKGLADSIAANFKKHGGRITASVAHEDGKGDYSAEVATLAQAGGDALVVAGYLDQGGKGIIQAAVDSGAFEMFVLPDGMIGDSLAENIGTPLNGSFGTRPSAESKGAKTFADLANYAGFKDGPYAAQSYDAAALILLAMQAAGSSTKFKHKVFDVANAPGIKIGPGQLRKAMGILASGGDINYVGASDVELIKPGESAGTYAEIEVKNRKMVSVDFH